MIPITSLYCYYDPDCNGYEYPKLEFKVSGTSTQYYRDIGTELDVLSIHEFDYSNLKCLTLDSSQYTYTIDVSKLLKLPITSLTIDQNTNYINGTIEDILNGMPGVTNLVLRGFTTINNLDLSAFKKLRFLDICTSELANLTLPDVNDLELSLLECDISNPSLVLSLTDINLTSRAIARLTLYRCTI